MLSPMSPNDALIASSGAADYQRKMAKAMKVRAERHDQALVAMKAEHAAHVERLKAEFKRDAEAAAARHSHELGRHREEGADILSAAVESSRRAAAAERERALDELRNELDESHRASLAAVMKQHQEALRGLAEHHKAELREKMSSMALSKDELHKGDKDLSLKTAAQGWEAEMARRVAHREATLEREHAEEIESIRRECGAAVEAMATKHAEEKQRLGGDMLDQREETRAVTAKAEQVKAAKALEAERKALTAKHEDACKMLHQQRDNDVAAERKRMELELKDAVLATSAAFEERVKALEATLHKAKAEHSQAAQIQLANSGRIAEKLQAERDELKMMLLGKGNSNMSVFKTILVAAWVGLIGVVASYSMVMIYEYRQWLFLAYSADKRFV